MSVKIVATNKKAKFNYNTIEKFEAGIELKGTEVKSIRKGKLNLSDGFVSIEKGEIFLKQVHISPYEQGNIFNVDPLRIRKLLLHKKEIVYLLGQVKLKGYAIIPLCAYFSYGKVKIEIALVQGKKNYDKRADMAKKDQLRNIDRAIKNFNNKER